MEWVIGVILLLVCLFLWAAIGHGIWVFVKAIFSGLSSRSCPACRCSLAAEDKACRHCGWTSAKLDTKEGLSICRMAMAGALQRHLIDEETMQRGLQILEQLEDQLDLERKGKRPRRPSLATQHPHHEVVVTKEHIAGDPDANPRSIPEPASAPEPPPTQKPAAPETQVHALDREYETYKPSVAPKLQPDRTWTQWMNAFLEESNIRWGELVGGLLIVCCSVALVISFWENIASRPWLKFSIFTGINIATFGLGLYAWHRWKLPTTSKGILVIGLMLLPLNFLAFALFTLGMPWDWFTVGGEMASLAVLGILAWQASKVLTPTAVWITTLTPIAFALANLLIRRTVSEDADEPLLYVWSAALLGLYTAANGIAWISLLKRSEGRFAPALEFFALATFSILIASGLLLRCTGAPMESFRMLSPLLSLLVAPSLYLAIDISRRLEKGSSLTLPMILLGAGAIGVGGASMLFATPMPLRMIGTALGWLALVGVAAIHFRHAGMGYPFYLISSLILVLGWHGFTGQLAWTNESSQTLLRVVSTPTTGFLWVGWSLVCGIFSIALARLRLPGASLTALRSAAILGVLGTIVLTALGLGREKYAMSVGSVYGIYAAASFAIGMVRKKPWVEGIGIVFLAAAAVQWIAVGWVDSHWIQRAFGCLAGVATVLLLVMMIRQAIGQPSNKGSFLSAASLAGIASTSLTALAWFFLAESTSWIDGAPFSISTWVFACLLWFLFAWIQSDSNGWRIAQWTAIACCMLEVVLRSKLSPWWSGGENGYLHPLFVQYASLVLFLCGGLLIGLDAWLRRIGRSSLAAIAGPLPSLHDSSVARYAVAFSTVATMGLLVYGALPGILQELIPRNAISTTELTSFIQDGETLERSVPALSALELQGIPHAAASWGIGSDRYRVWGLPPMWMAWGVGLLALGCILWNERRSDAKFMASWLGVAISLGLALWYPIASRFESSVAVASSLRWLTAIFFFASSLALSFWIRRVDRSAEPEASRSFARFDHAFAAFSMNTLVPWIAMIAIVGLSVLWRVEVLPWRVWTWVITGSMAAFSSLLLALQFNQAQNASKHQVRSVAAITAATLMAAPLVTWVIFLIAVTVIANPLTGPNPDSFFARIGLAGSYAIPILLISVALVSVSAARPSPHLAFVSALFMMVTVVVGYMLILKSNGIRVEAWVGLAAALAGTSSIFSMVWRAYTARDTRSDTLLHWSGRPALLVRQEWQTALNQVSASFVLVGLFLTVGIVLVQPVSMSGLTWASVGILAAIGILMIERRVRRGLSDLAPWIGAIGIAAMGSAAPLWGSVDRSLTFSALVMIVTGGVMIANSARRAQGPTERLNAFPFLFWILAILVGLSIRLALDRITLAGPWPRVGFLPVAILIAAWGLAIVNTWLHRDRWSWLCSLLMAQGAGLIYTVLVWTGPSLLGSQGWNTVFVQCAIMSLSSGIGTLLGFGNRVRIPLVIATVVLALCSGGWLFYALVINPSSALPAFPSGSYGVAIAACLLGGATGYWSLRSRGENGVVYVSGLCGVVWMLQALVPSGDMIPWLATVFLAAYCLATSFLWRSGDRLQEELAKLIRIPKTVDKAPAKLVVAMNILLALVVAWMGIAAQLQQGNLNIRFVCSNSIMAVAFAVGILARHVSLKSSSPRLLETVDGPPVGSTSIRVLALVLGVLYSVALFWHVQSIESTSLLDRVSVALLPVTLIGAAYAFGLIKGMGLKQEWEQAAFLILPWIVMTSIVGGMACLAIEYQQSGLQGDHSAVLYPALCVALSFALAIVLCLGAALLPGRDPLGLTERGREAYIYTAQAILVLLVIHLRIVFPWLFAGLLQTIWPLVLLLVGFGGIAAAEWSQRRGWKVLANPLRNSGGMLPLLPILGPWLAESRIDYGVTLVTAAVGYGLFGFMKRSPIYIAASAMAANGAIWYLLHRSEFSFSKHPQLWVIPPALCVFAATQFARHLLTASQVAIARYASIGSIYVASTSEIFLQGISEAPWLPIVLAFLSVLGILFGIASRIRSMLWLGSMFLCVALFSILWYAAVDLEQTWIWYVSGIVLGAIILIVFALFEKRREDLKRIVSSMQRWEE